MQKITLNAVQNAESLQRLLSAIDREVDGIRTLVNELRTDHATFKSVIDDIKPLVNTLRARHLTKCLGPANFEIDTNFDVKNGVGFDIIVDGEIITIVTDQTFDTGTAKVIETAAYWAGAILSIDADGTTYVDWGDEAEDEAGAIANLADVTVSGDVICGYTTVHAKDANDFVCGTDALATGTGGEVAQATNYYNIIEVGDAAIGSAVTTSAPASISASAVSEQVKRTR